MSDAKNPLNYTPLQRARNVARGLSKMALLLAGPQSWLRQTGYFRSMLAGRPVDRKGQPLPWMNYSMIGFLKERLAPDMRVFEYGSGSSTLFFASRVESIVSVEHDKGWYEKIRGALPANATLLYRAYEKEGDEYCRAITQAQGPFDLVIVDGRDRVNCVTQALPCLSENGVVLLDNSMRARYAPAHEMMKKAGFKALYFDGLLPLEPSVSDSTLFYRENNIFGI